MAHFQTLNHSFTLWFIDCRIYFSGKIFHPFESQLVLYHVVKLLPVLDRMDPSRDVRIRHDLFIYTPHLFSGELEGV